MKKRLILSIFLLGAGIVLSSCNNDRNKVESTTVETTEKPQETITETTTETATETTTKTIVETTTETITETTTETTKEPEETSSLADLPWVES